MNYIYMIKCKDLSIYTGVAKDLKKRLNVHHKKLKSAAKYTRTHDVNELCALWTTNNRSNAQKLEYRIKKLKRDQKIRLISDNSIFSDIFFDIDKEDFKRIANDTLTEHKNCLRG